MALALGLVSGEASDASGVLFYASQDGSYDSVGPLSASVAPGRGTPTFVPGKRGQAILTGADLGFLNYTLAREMPAATGSVEFWVCPEDWDGMTDDQGRNFFSSKGEEGYVDFVKADGRSRIVYLTTSPSVSAFAAPRSQIPEWTGLILMIHEWKPGQWRHFLGTWNPLESVLYVDGKVIARSNELNPLTRLPRNFVFGDTAGKGHTRFDELYVYDRPLTSEEAVWCYEHALDRVAGQDLPTGLVKSPVRVQVKPSPARGSALVQAVISGADDPAGLQAEIFISAGDNSIRVPVAEWPGRVIEKEVELKGLPGGDYPLNVILKGPGGEFARGETLLPWAGNPEWRGTGVGMDPVVSPGYQPISVSGNDFQCLGRKYSVGSNGLPRQIQSAGVDMLREPIEFQIATAAGPEKLGKLQCKVERLNDGTATVRAAGEGTSLAYRLDGEAYFDGLFKYTVSLTPKGSATIKRLVLRMPLRNETAVYYHYPYSKRSFGVLPSAQGALAAGEFGPFLWLGGDDCGLMFMCESDEPFRNSNPAAAYQIVRTPEGVEMQVTVIDLPLKLEGEWKLTFGLQASPVRPLAKDWRKWTLAGSKPKFAYFWPNPELMQHFGYPGPGPDPRKLTAAVKKFHDAGSLMISYINPSMLSGGSREWFQFGRDWRLPGSADTSPDVAAFGPSILGVCASSRDWQDFLTWKTAGYLKEYDIDGLYYDHTSAARAFNQLYGDGYLRDGIRHPTYMIFSKRELYRRMYNMVKTLKKDSMIFAHTSDTVPLPYLGFCDAYAAGEGLASRLKDNYLEVESIEYYRAQYGHQWGCSPFWLNEFAGTFGGVTDMRHWVGLCQLLDCGVWQGYGTPEGTAECKLIMDALIAHGWENAEFRPYWKNERLIAGQTDAVKVSSYQSDRGTILVALNLTREPQKARLQLDPKGLKLPAGYAVKDLRTEQELAAPGGVIDLALDGMGLKLIFLEPGQLR